MNSVRNLKYAFSNISTCHLTMIIDHLSVNTLYALAFAFDLM